MENLIIEAARFAEKAHGDQKRKYGGQPYIHHPARVAARTTLIPEVDEVAVAVAWLHDVVEDTKVSPMEIEEKFGERVVQGVLWLTNVSTGSSEKRAIRKKLDRDHIEQAPNIYKQIKMYDRLDNLSDLHWSDADPVWKAKYAKESLLLIDAIGSAQPTLADFIRNICEELIEGSKPKE